MGDFVLFSVSQTRSQEVVSSDSSSTAICLIYNTLEINIFQATQGRAHC